MAEIKTESREIGFFKTPSLEDSSSFPIEQELFLDANLKKKLGQYTAKINKISRENIFQETRSIHSALQEIKNESLSNSENIGLIAIEGIYSQLFYKIACIFFLPAFSYANSQYFKTAIEGGLDCLEQCYSQILEDKDVSLLRAVKRGIGSRFVDTLKKAIQNQNDKANFSNVEIFEKTLDRIQEFVEKSVEKSTWIEKNCKNDMEAKQIIPGVAFNWVNSFVKREDRKESSYIDESQLEIFMKKCNAMIDILDRWHRNLSYTTEYPKDNLFCIAIQKIEWLKAKSLVIFSYKNSPDMLSDGRNVVRRVCGESYTEFLETIKSNRALIESNKFLTVASNFGFFLGDFYEKRPQELDKILEYFPRKYLEPYKENENVIQISMEK